MFFDGSFTQQGSGAGILFIMPQRYSLPKAYKILFPCTNNIAEYEALINGMKIAAEWRVDQLNVFGDSQLVINQVNDIYQTKDEKLLPYKRMVDDLKKYFAHITFQQVPRADNKAADAMATLASLLQMPENDLRHEFLVDTLHYPAYDTPKTRMICSIVGHDSSRYHHIYSYLRDQIIPDGLT